MKVEQQTRATPAEAGQGPALVPRSLLLVRQISSTVEGRRAGCRSAWWLNCDAPKNAPRHWRAIVVQDRRRLSDFTRPGGVRAVLKSVTS
jgi:hypothetical protein